MYYLDPAIRAPDWPFDCDYREMDFYDRDRQIECKFRGFDIARQYNRYDPVIAEEFDKEDSLCTYGHWCAPKILRIRWTRYCYAYPDSTYFCPPPRSMIWIAEQDRNCRRCVKHLWLRWGSSSNNGTSQSDDE